MLRLTLSVVLVLTISPWAVAADDSPLTIAVSSVGNFAKGGPWYLSVNSAGKAELTIEAGIGHQIGFSGRLKLPRINWLNFETVRQRKVFRPGR